MVFYYTIRGGPCRGSLSEITLRSQDICCYVGRDKHENETLIEHGWPGDVWFHVNDLSSAHVYFRLHYEVASRHHDGMIPLDGAIPMDELPEDSIEDMMQIVKHNSIQGSKLTSCKIVWTPHANLKKTFDMAAGAVTYHDTQQCRYGRCHKDRARIKALEKTKSVDRTDVDFYAIRKANERALLERRKKAKANARDGLYDPIDDDARAQRTKATQEGDQNSGLDQGLASLESLSLGSAPVAQAVALLPHSNVQPKTQHSTPDQEDLPQWKREKAQWETTNNETAIFLLERGYPKEKVETIQKKHPSHTNVQLLSLLWKGLGSNPHAIHDADPEELQERRQEEREVLEAIFGDELEWLADEKNGLDASVPITPYEIPERYGNHTPELRLEIYLPPNSRYPYQSPTLALIGGGIPQWYLHQWTQQLYQQTVQEELVGEPQLFHWITWVGESWEEIVRQEQKETQAKLEAARKEKAAAAAKNKPTAGAAQQQTFASEQERREYARTTAKGAAAAPSKKKAAPKRVYNNRASDQKLIEDLFS